MSEALTNRRLELPGSLQPSTRSYAVAVILSAVFGFLGVQHFYLGRYSTGILDVGLSIGWIVSFLHGEVVLGIVLAVADFAHAFGVTIALLTGNYRDGEGRIVAYPGQILTTNRG